MWEWVLSFVVYIHANHAILELICLLLNTRHGNAVVESERFFEHPLPIIAQVDPVFALS